MPRLRVQLPSGSLSEHKREYALLKQIGDGSGDFDTQV
jgi:hypothetical protein